MFRYDRPRLIHQSHVKVILQTTPLRKNSGKELQRQQHFRALDAAESEPLNKFITSIIELKLDSNTLFEWHTLFKWHKHTQGIIKVPHFHDILQFIDLQARASETTTSNHKRIQKVDIPSNRAVASFVRNPGLSANNCVICKGERHPLYYCNVCS